LRPAHLAPRLLLLFALPICAALAEKNEADYGGLPPDVGREVTFDNCNACHSTMLVAQQRLARDIWDETLDYMVEEHGMDSMESGERRKFLDYLSTYLNDETPR